MNKNTGNTIIGFVVIFAIMTGFMFWQSSKQQEAAQAAAALADAVTEDEESEQLEAAALEAEAEDTASEAVETSAVDAPEAPEAAEEAVADTVEKVLTPVEKAKAAVDNKVYVLKNDVFEVGFAAKGARPYYAKLETYKNYDSTDTYVIRPGESDLNMEFTTKEDGKFDTRDCYFSVVEKTDTSIVMQMAFGEDSYIEQVYSIRKGEYMVYNTLRFVNMYTKKGESILKKNRQNFGYAFQAFIPRMEKGYDNEKRYSKIDYRENNGEVDDVTSSEDGLTGLSWFAFQQQFFSAIVRSGTGFCPTERPGSLKVEYMDESDLNNRLMRCSALMTVPFVSGDNEMSESMEIPFEYYLGPNHYQTLKEYDQSYEDVIPLGGWLIGWFTKWVIIPTFNFLKSFGWNFGLIILLMTILLKLVLLPLTYKSYSSSAKMQVLKPEMDKIAQKYPKQEDAMKKQQATMDLYKRAGVSPMGGCLPMLLQMPILWAMFRFFPASIELRQQPFLWADDLSAYDDLINFGGTSIPLLGDHVSLFALLMAVSMFFYSRFTSAQMASGNDPNAKMMKFFSLWMMPIMMFFICNSLSSGLSYYYLLSNLFTIVQTIVIRKFFVKPEAVLAKLKANEGKKTQKSKWQLRLEAAQKMQQEQMRNRK